MPQTWKYVTPKDEESVGSFAAHYLKQIAPRPNGPLYHYTTGESLIRIIESQKLRATQISCLNDTKELMYAAEELRKMVKARIATNRHAALVPFLNKIEEYLSNLAAESSNVFVFCLSAQADQLGQWRAYSGGEGGYAIEFDSTQLHESGLPAQIFLVKVEYLQARQTALFESIIKWGIKFYLKCDGKRSAPTRVAWLNEFSGFFLTHVALFLPCLKNPAYSEEQEWRLVCFLAPDDTTQIQFMQRQSMMSRHIYLNMSGQLPITGVMVGPQRHPNISKIAVGDLLQQNGHSAAVNNVTVTTVPYRIA